MTVAVHAGETSNESGLDLKALRLEMTQLRLTLLGLQSDIDEATGPVRPPGLNKELKQGVRRALRTVDDVRHRLGG